MAGEGGDGSHATEVAPTAPRAGMWAPVAVVAVFALLAAGAVVARARDLECPATGCQPMAVFDLPSLPSDLRAAAAGATFCLDETCTTQPIAEDRPLLRTALPAAVVPSATVVLLDANGAEVGRVTSTHGFVTTTGLGRGTDCEPPCPLLLLTARDGALEQIG